MKIGLFGGTFDPIHMGHLILAEQCREKCSLDEIWFIPAASPPHKTNVIATFEQRAAMLHLAVAGNDYFKINTIESERIGPSYTFQTLELLSAQHPNHEWFLIIGSDALADINNWYNSEKIIKQVTFITSPRPGTSVIRQKGLKTIVCYTPQIEISSSNIRERLKSKKSVRYLLPEKVVGYIGEYRIYGW